ncbi:MAG: GIY-YIG nuclease family protein [Pseudomonadota bacterium]
MSAAPALEWYVYLLRTRDGSLYTGIARDVERRLKQHETSPRGARSLRSRGPLKIEYHAPLSSRSLALKVEYRIKQLNKAGKEALIAEHPSPESLVARFLTAPSDQ